jgi:hypothetical protein
MGVRYLLIGTWAVSALDFTSAVTGCANKNALHGPFSRVQRFGCK